MKEKNLEIEFGNVEVKIDNSSTIFKDMIISEIELEKNCGHPIFIQIDIEDNTFKIGGMMLSPLQTQALKMFINQVK